MRKDKITGMVLAMPVLLGTFLFFAVPFFISIWYSFTFGVGGAEFVGFANYASVFSSPAFQLAARNTLRFLCIGVPLILLLSFVIALCIKQKLPGSRFFRSILLLPLVLPIASLVMVIQVFFAEAGILNHILAALGAPVWDWMHSPHAFSVLLGMYIWKNCGYNIILLLSGLNMIPDELYQTASMEGAGSFQKLRYITLPLLGPSLFFTFIMSIVNSFKSYREAFLLGGKHPHDSIYMLQHFLNNNFDNLNYQRLSVAAILLFLLIFLFVAALYVFQNRLEEALI